MPEPYTGQSRQLLSTSLINPNDEEACRARIARHNRVEELLQQDIRHQSMRDQLLGDKHILCTEHKYEGSGDSGGTSSASNDARAAANAALEEACRMAEQNANRFLLKKDPVTILQAGEIRETMVDETPQQTDMDITEKQKRRLAENQNLAQALEWSVKREEEEYKEELRVRLPSARGSTCFLMDEINQLNQQKACSHSSVSSMGAKHESDDESL